MAMEFSLINRALASYSYNNSTRTRS